uniref:Uncharacterized protein n=1 Tax=Arundo donax TaxID=35708 RepID=A0A0A9CRT1_ARUDO
MAPADLQHARSASSIAGQRRRPGDAQGRGALSPPWRGRRAAELAIAGCQIAPRPGFPVAGDGSWSCCGAGGRGGGPGARQRGGAR